MAFWKKIFEKLESIKNKFKTYSLRRRSFQMNNIQRKINKLVSTKKNIEIPSNPNEKVKFINSEPKV